jgi:hypothetical protein
LTKKSEPKEEPPMMRRQTTLEDRLPKGFKNKLIELEFALEKGQVT